MRVNYRRMRRLLGAQARQLLRGGCSSPAAVRWSSAQTRLFCSSPPPGEDRPPPSMLRHLTSKIKATGPIPVAEYMREVLTNPVTVTM
ncbi:hypothetical protein INR49_017984 [Caranx melampygus]|nr:hypothetical protein INR49_017984 [Caranx melampygus]